MRPLSITRLAGLLITFFIFASPTRGQAQCCGEPPAICCDNKTWIRRDNTGPLALWELPTMAYDIVRNKMVLYTGYDARFTSDGSTWEWNGSSWANVTPVLGGLPIRGGGALATNPISGGGGVVLYGAYYYYDSNYVWIWDGVSWTTLNPAIMPPARYNNALAYDSDRDRVVLFGGNSIEPPNPPFGDTWEWDGTSWTGPLATSDPRYRYNHALAYDDFHYNVVLFGGTDDSYDFDETRFWDGLSWGDPRTPLHTLNSRAGHAMAYDAQCRNVIRFGGSRDDFLSHFPTETWAWNGTSWEIVATTGPGARWHPAMAYDSARASVVLFGGSDPVETNLTDTWEWAVPEPVITEQPLSQTVELGQSVTLSVTATSVNPELHYFWYKNGVYIPTGVNASLTINSATLSDAGDYYVKISDAPCGNTLASSTAHLTVTCAPITLSPLPDYYVTAPQSVSITVRTNGTGPLTYQWRYQKNPPWGSFLNLGNFNNYVGALTPTLSIYSTSTFDSGVYDVVITDACNNSAISPPATLTVVSDYTDPIVGTDPGPVNSRPRRKNPNR
ncbi:MAG TPA: immunoglobulin domain-containing protein [Bdellovibrionota bacterium]|nr:immunoglobulin domain-containing protein [Bdellovibrionota bacterium]